MAVPSAFPSELPPRASPSWKDRNCPNMRSCWTISISSYSLKTSDKAVLARRICMIAILAIRTAIAVLSIIGNAWGARVVSVIVGTILGVIGFFFIAWCLAKIGDAQGYRKVLGVRVGRWHFDVFLFGMAILHVMMFIGSFFGFDGSELGASWIVLWLLIFAVAWIATWEPEAPESQV
ncbi:hypothetical protein BS50DRAFT_235928 [Corynespora cassiicola Philippines]|uniref:Uncharacterized protein n=1 Tax=Corynespora cassiicola Philippines TaxID=1448308 RepID=A0A2T2P2B5_CORCC|nr:hypothetical protein BS50DRAFT_235928 [Corynespora cassiicola Philippines]